MEILPLLDGWSIDFPYFQQNILINTNKYTEIYKTNSKGYDKGYIFFSIMAISTDNFSIRLTVDETGISEIPFQALAFGQSKSGFSVPSALAANVYVPAFLYSQNLYIADGFSNPYSVVAYYSSIPFPYKNGLSLEIQVNDPPQTIAEVSLGIIGIDDFSKFKSSFKDLFTGGKNGTN